MQFLIGAEFSTNLQTFQLKLSILVCLALINGLDSYCLAAKSGAQNPMILNLVSDGQATNVASNSGDWTSPATWQGGQIPGNSGRVVIPAGVVVTVDSELTANLKTVRVDGILRFDQLQNTRLKVDTLVVTADGHLEIGTVCEPIASSVTAEILFVDDGSIDTNWDPGQFSRGLLVLGSTEMFGSDVTDFEAVATHPTAGASSIQLRQTPNGWDVGDQVAITGSQGVQSDEVRTISSINGGLVGLNNPLNLDHIPPRSDINIYVANTTRNIRISSENPDVRRRGHIMMVHTLDVTMDNVGMYELGRTDKSMELDDLFFEFTKGVPENESPAPIIFEVFGDGDPINIRGRYSLHFHRGGFHSPSPALVNGCVVFGSPGWGFVNHTGHVEFRSNVAYGCQGSGYYTETGDEIGLFDGNIAIRSFNPRDPVNVDDMAIDPDLGHSAQEFGNSGDGFWLSGHRVSVTNNVATGASGHGIIIWSDGVCEADRPRTTIPVAELENGHLIPNRTEVPNWWAPLAEFKNNECANATIGFRARYIHSQSYLGNGNSDFHEPPPQAYMDTLKPTIDGALIWGCRDGSMFNYCERMRLKNFDIVGIGAEFIFNEGTANVGMGMDLATEITRGPGRLENISISGFNMGIVAPRHDSWTLENITLSNTMDMMIQEARFSPRSLTMSNVTFGSLAGTAVEGMEDERINLYMQPLFDFFGQPFYFVLPDHITLDGQGVYFEDQMADFVPVPEPPAPGDTFLPIPPSFIGRTNQELNDMFGLSFGGELLPEDADADDRVLNGYVGSPPPAATVFPELVDMTGAGNVPEPPMGGPIPELTVNALEICSGQTVVLLSSNLNSLDTDTGFAELLFDVQDVTSGFFVHRDQPSTAITSFSQAEINAGVIRFVHDGSTNVPSYSATLTDGTSTTTAVPAAVTFCGGGNGAVLLGDVNLDGLVNLLDVAAFIDRISSGTFQAEADINQDGVVNLLDVGPFVAILSNG